MLQSLLQGPHAGQQLASLILVLFAAVYAVYAVFGRPHDAVRPVLHGIPAAGLLGVYTYAFDLNQGGAYSRLLTDIVGTTVSSSTLLLLGAGVGFAQPFISDYARTSVKWDMGKGRLRRDVKGSPAAATLSVLVRMALAAFWVALGLMVAVDRYHLLLGAQLTLSSAALAGVALGFLLHLRQLVELARERGGERTSLGGRALLTALASVAGILTAVAVVALFVFAATHLGWSVVVYLLLFSAISAVCGFVQSFATRLPRPAVAALAILLLLVAGALQLAARA